MMTPPPSRVSSRGYAALTAAALTAVLLVTGPVDAQRGESRRSPADRGPAQGGRSQGRPVQGRPGQEGNPGRQPEQRRPEQGGPEQRRPEPRGPEQRRPEENQDGRQGRDGPGNRDRPVTRQQDHGRRDGRNTGPGVRRDGRDAGGRRYDTGPWDRYNPRWSQPWVQPWVSPYAYALPGPGLTGAYAWGPSGYPGGLAYDYPPVPQMAIGAVRLDVNGPGHAEVLVDGYLVGILDDFDGAFQPLELEAGLYRVEILAPGYAPLVMDLRIQPGRTLTYRGSLRREQ